MRHGLVTWAYQFAHVGRTHSFELGDWEAWAAETAELDAPGFYAAWRVLEDAQRAVLRGRVAEGRQKLALATELVGTESSQGVAGIDTINSIFAFATQDWESLMPAARRAFTMFDTAEPAAIHAAVGAAATNQPDWCREALIALDSQHRSGVHIDAVVAGIRATLALLEGRWVDARSDYLEARRGLGASGGNYALALLNLSVGTRGQGQFPEADEAMAAAREFFASVGAEHLVDAYVAALVPSTAPERAPLIADAPSGVRSA
jgi:hypothetical protein